MISRRVFYLATSAMLIAGIAGYWVYADAARQGEGGRDLAQSPLNVEDRVPSSFIMVVDDSNSMMFERLFSGGDGNLRWNSSGQTFFKADGSYYGQSNCSGTGRYFEANDCYLHVFPYGTDSSNNNSPPSSRYNSQYYYGRAMPPLDQFGFFRSHQFNSTYYNPATTYEPWLRADGTTYPNASITAARTDPRPTSQHYGFTFDMTTDRAERGHYDRFAFQSRMVVPAGVEYALQSGWSTAPWRTAPAAGYSVPNDTMLAIKYFPATYYLRDGTDTPAGYNPSMAPLIANACGPGCNMRRYQIKPGNYTDSAQYAKDIQNFANWFQYHRNRLLAMVGSMTHAFKEIKNMRVGYTTINDMSNYPTRQVMMRDLTSDTDKSALYDSMLGLVTTGGTPNREAVKAAAEQFRRTDANAPVLRSCQKNALMLFTDGYTNTSTASGSGSIGNVDRNLGAPFADNYSNTIADIVSRYYYSEVSGTRVPLRTGADFPAGKVPVPDQCTQLDPADPNRLRQDCQTDLHLNFYGITLGAQGQIYGVNLDATNDPYTSHPNWNSAGTPEIISREDGAVIDEIWHATVNTRGEYINAQTPEDVTDAMRRILAMFGTGSGQSGTIAVSGSRVTNDSNSIILEPTYTSANSGTDWYSSLIAWKATRENNRVVTRRAWDAAEVLATNTNRNIHVGRVASNGDFSVNPFTSSSMGTFALDDLCSDTLANCTSFDLTALGITKEQAINYLRGDKAQEGQLRTRNSLLGDIINSSPRIISKNDDYGYRSLRDPSGATINNDYFDYQDYRNGSQTRPDMVFVGANDGMFHVFDAETGKEVWAYIPSTALTHMGTLLFPYNPDNKADQIFQHRYYVDGLVSASDVRMNDQWRTVVVMPSGAGGRSVFAVDVTNRSRDGSGFQVLWELNDKSANADVKNHLGYMLGRVAIVPVLTGNAVVSWKAIFGNGYNSDSGKAVLFVVDIATGAVQTVVAEENDATLPARNGLGNVIVVDRYKGSGTVSGTDGYADTVYAADQNGAIWKFDLRGNPTLTMSKPLFVAKDQDGERQAILGGFAATRGPGGGVMLYFGSGSFSFESDAEDTAVQSFYAIQDREDGKSVARNQLEKRTIVGSGNGTIMISTQMMGSDRLGWLLDLAKVNNGRPNKQGERVLGTPAVESGVVFFTTYEPTTSDGCGGFGSNRIYGLNALTGAASMSMVRIGSPDGPTAGVGVGGLDLATDGSAPVKDIGVLATSRLPPLGSGATEEEIAAALANRCSMVIRVAGSEPLYIPRPCGRQSWRQLR